MQFPLELPRVNCVILVDEFVFKETLVLIIKTPLSLPLSLCSPFPPSIPNQAYLQTSAAVSDAGETVAIVYEYESGAFFQSPLSDEDE